MLTYWNQHTFVNLSVMFTVLLQGKSIKLKGLLLKGKV